MTASMCLLLIVCPSSVEHLLIHYRSCISYPHLSCYFLQVWTRGHTLPSEKSAAEGPIAAGLRPNSLVSGEASAGRPMAASSPHLLHEGSTKQVCSFRVCLP